jgi:hypothetical protein
MQRHTVANVGADSDEFYTPEPRNADQRQHDGPAVLLSEQPGRNNSAHLALNELAEGAKMSSTMPAGGTKPDNGRRAKNVDDTDDADETDRLVAAMASGLRRSASASGEMAQQGPLGHPAIQSIQQKLVRLVGYRNPIRDAATTDLVALQLAAQLIVSAK